MELDRQRAQAAFAAYVRPYDTQDPKIKLKITHTYRVAALCERIAASLGLPAADLDLAWLCGLLHDIGRFEQVRRFGTFNDAVSVDHAKCSAAVLFDEGHIADFVDGDDAFPLLRTAIEQHNVYRLPAELDDRTRMFCQILRDADKIDILRVNVETPLEEIYGVSRQELLQSPISPAVLQAFYEHHAVLRSLKQYPADNIIGHTSLVFELCYPESRRLAAEQGWLWQLFTFRSENPETETELRRAKAHLRAWLDALQTQKNALK